MKMASLGEKIFQRDEIFYLFYLKHLRNYFYDICLFFLIFKSPIYMVGNAKINYTQFLYPEIAIINILAHFVLIFFLGVHT